MVFISRMKVPDMCPENVKDQKIPGVSLESDNILDVTQTEDMNNEE